MLKFKSKCVGCIIKIVQRALCLSERWYVWRHWINDYPRSVESNPDVSVENKNECWFGCFMCCAISCLYDWACLRLIIWIFQTNIYVCVVWGYCLKTKLYPTEFNLSSFIGDMYRTRMLVDSYNPRTYQTNSNDVIYHISLGDNACWYVKLKVSLDRRFPGIAHPNPGYVCLILKNVCKCVVCMFYCCIRTHTHIYIYVYIHIRIYIYIYIYRFICLCIDYLVTYVHVCMHGCS